MALRLKGIQVCTFALPKAPYLNASLIDDIGGCYHSTKDLSLSAASRDHGPYDLILEATGVASLVFEAMHILWKNGVLVLAGVSGGGRSVEVPGDQINLGFVLGNKVVVGTVNANREYFEMGVKDLAHAQLQWPGWAAKLLTDPINGLDRYQDMMRTLTEAKGAIKVFVNVASLPG